ncbi:MAG: DMT family transporter [Chloroflexi bacterium]|nr:DMT family transporter [Chloroflexota bacterium]
MSERERVTAAAFVLAVVIGGLNFVAVRYSNEQLPPFWGATLRFGVAAALFFLLALLLRLDLPRGRALVGVLLYGALGFGASYAFIYWGLLAAPAALASVLTSLVPLLTVVLAAMHGLERLDWRRLAGGLVAAGGIALVFVDQLGSAVPLASLLALLAAALCIAESGVLAKLFPRAHPVATNAVGMSAGTAVLAALTLLTGESRALPAAPATWVALAYLVLVGSMGLFALYLFILGRWTASATSFILVFFPIITIAAGVVLRDERVSGAFVVGVAIVLGGVYLGALARGRPVAGPPPRPAIMR